MSRPIHRVMLGALSSEVGIDGVKQHLGQLAELERGIAARRERAITAELEADQDD